MNRCPSFPFSGALTRILVAPLDVLKIRVQVLPHPSPLAASFSRSPASLRPQYTSVEFQKPVSVSYIHRLGRQGALCLQFLSAVDVTLLLLPGRRQGAVEGLVSALHFHMRTGLFETCAAVYRLCSYGWATLVFNFKYMTRACEAVTQALPLPSPAEASLDSLLQSLLILLTLSAQFVHITNQVRSLLCQ